MDNQATESASSSLDTNQAAEIFANMLEPRKEEQAESIEAEAEAEEPEAEASESDVLEGEGSEEQPQTFTVKIDGKEVPVTLEELTKGYQRQADYTRKTMEVAEQRKAAEAEASQARAQREQYASRLQEAQIILQNALQEQSNIDWQNLIESDPIEYLKQQNLYQQRQAAYQQNIAEQQKLSQLHQAEQAENAHRFLAQQQEQLLAKLPDWKDEAKASAEKAELREYLAGKGELTHEEIESIADHRHLLIARKAMLYDKMISKAQAASKKVENLPKKVERPGVGQAPSIDKRSSAFQKLSKSGRVEDAAAVFASLL